MKAGGRGHASPYAAPAAVLAALLLAGCLAQATRPAAPPPPERARSISSGADAELIARVRIRIAALRRAVTAIKAYHLAKAEAWLDFAVDAGKSEASGGTAEDALDQADAIVRALERGVTPALRTVQPVASRRVRDDLWLAGEELKNSAGFPCAGVPLARAEVALVRAGHLAYIDDAQGADDMAARAQAYLDDTRREAERCLAAGARGAEPPAERPPAPLPPAGVAPAAGPVAEARPRANDVAMAGSAAQPSANSTAAPDAAPDAITAPGAAGHPAGVSIERVRLPADALFPFGAVRLDAARNESLRALAQHIRALPDVLAVRINGHTDRLSRGGADFNRRLAASRARAVGKALVAYGVAPALIDARGHGDTSPVVECPGPRSRATIDCLAPNRRVDIEIERAQ